MSTMINKKPIPLPGSKLEVYSTGDPAKRPGIVESFPLNTTNLDTVESTNSMGGTLSLSDLNLPPGTIVSPRSFKLLTGKSSPENVLPSNTNVETENLGDINRSQNQPFILKEKIAEGSYGAVYKAELCDLQEESPVDPNTKINPHNLKSTGKIVAVKIITSRHDDPEELKDSVGSINELDIMSRIRHPNLISLIGISLVDFVMPAITKNGVHPKTTVAITMPLAINNLGNYINNNKIGFVDKVHIIWQIMQGLRYLHSRSILHLDLKNENVLVLSTNPLRVAVGDFGLSLYADRKCSKEYPKELVTITYRAPELFSNKNKHYTDKVDVWSVGMCFLYMILETKHIFPYIEPNDRVHKFIKRTFSENNRRDILIKYINKTNYTNPQKFLIIDFLDNILRYNPANRPDIKTMLNHQLFSTIFNRNEKLEITEGMDLYPLIWVYPPEKLGLEVYLALNFLFRLSLALNISAETYFIAADFFHRSIAYLYTLRDYFIKIPNVYWQNGCNSVEILSLGALVSFSIAIKANEYYTISASYIKELSGNCYSLGSINEMERQLIVGARGIIYRWNPFKDAANWSDLISGFELTTNAFTYPIQQMKCSNSPPIIGYYKEDDPHKASFENIYKRSKYYSEMYNYPEDNAVPIRRFNCDRNAFFSTHRLKLTYI